MKYQISIRIKDRPKKHPKKMNATLKKGPKKLFQIVATLSGLNLAGPNAIPGVPLSGAPQLRQNLSSLSTEYPQFGQFISGHSFQLEIWKCKIVP
jgi:hypothetical protein